MTIHTLPTFIYLHSQPGASVLPKTDMRVAHQSFGNKEWFTGVPVYYLCVREIKSRTRKKDLQKAVFHIDAHQILFSNMSGILFMLKRCLTSWHIV